MGRPITLLEVEVNGDWKPSYKAGFVKIFVPGRWFRIGLTFGAPPGSRIGVWRTRSYVRGINLRIGRRYTGPCLTIMAHTRSTDENWNCSS